jgi:DNA-binding transcriptional MerR regulator
MLQPQNNRAGLRTYRSRDFEMELRIKQLLYDEQYTIAGAKKKLAAEQRGPSRDSGQLAPARPAGRSLQRPPSLAARFTRAASSEASAPGSPNDDQRPTLRQIAKQLREVLDLLDEGDAEIAADQPRRK